MATALVQVSAPEDLCSSAAPTGFSPLRNLGNARLAVSGSGVALPAGPAPADFVVVTSAALIRPFAQSDSGPSQIPNNRFRHGLVLKTDVVVDVSLNGREWQRMVPRLTLIEMPLQAEKINEIVGRGGVWEKCSTSDNAAHIVVLSPVVPDTSPSPGPRLPQGVPRCGCGCAIGTETSVFGAPYGAFESHVFFNVMSNGLVSNRLTRGDSGHGRAASDGNGAGAAGGAAVATSRCSNGGTTLLLIDAPCPPGVAGARATVVTDDWSGGGGEALRAAGGSVEGGPSSRRTLGMVLPPLERNDGLTMELSFVLPWCRVVEALAPWLGHAPASPLHPSPSTGLTPAITRAPASSPRRRLRRQRLAATVAEARHATVLVYCASTWGTGVVVDAAHGIVVTNAHVFRGRRGQRFRGRLVADPGCPPHTTSRPRWYNLRPLFVSDNFIDVAVLQLETGGNGLPEAWALQPVASLGESRSLGGESLGDTTRETREPNAEVVVLGYPSISPLITPHPTVTYGRATEQRAPSPDHASGRPAIVLTSASVHPGSSGGPVVRLEDGGLVGILTSFTQCCDDDGNIIVAHPRLNFVVPASLLGPLWAFLEGGCSDLGVLRQLGDVSQIEATVGPFWPPTDAPKAPTPPAESVPQLNAKL